MKTAGIIMFKFKHKTLIYFSGIFWLVVGVSLLRLGLNFVVNSANTGQEAKLPLLHFIAPLAGGQEQGAIIIVAAALAVGFVKGRFVLIKSVNRVVGRIRGLQEPASITKIYSLPYYLLIGSMILLGVGIKYLGVPLDIRGLVDIAVGAALINGAMLYFRAARGYGKEKTA